MSQCTIDCLIFSAIAFAAGALTLRLIVNRRLDAGRRDIANRFRLRDLP